MTWNLMKELNSLTTVCICGRFFPLDLIFVSHRTDDSGLCLLFIDTPLALPLLSSQRHRPCTEAWQ